MPRLTLAEMSLANTLMIFRFRKGNVGLVEGGKKSCRTFAFPSFFWGGGEGGGGGY